MNEIASRGIANDYTLGSTKPDWAMCGITMGNGRVRLLASKTLSYAELTCDFTNNLYIYNDAFPMSALRTRYDITLSVQMPDLVMIDAADYEAAFKELFKTWIPKRQNSIEG